jgi:hypothetical protein
VRWSEERLRGGVFLATRDYRRGDADDLLPAPAPCTHCGDTVLVVEAQIGKLFGLNLRRAPKIRLEHADPGPGGDVFDAVDAGCRRPLVAR